MKRKVGLLSALLAVLILFAACGNNPESVSSGTSTANTQSSGTSTTNVQSGTPTELKVAYFVMGDIPKDQQLVEDEVNKIALQKINVKVELLPVALGQWAQQANLMLASGEKLDLITPQGAIFGSYVAQGKLTELDDLLTKYGQGIKDAIIPDYLKAGTVKGKVYAVTTLRDLASGTGFMIRKDYLEKYKIDVNKVKTIDDVESMILKPIKTAEPDLVPMLPQNATTTYATSMSGMDQAGGDTFGVLINRGQDLKLVNWYESSQYADLLKKFRSWYLAGYIMKDVATNKESVASLLKAQKGIAYINSTKPGVEIDESNNAGTQLVNIELLPPLATTSVPQRVQWAIPAQATTPEKSMQFLNLLYTDSAIVNLLDWGIEGKHYVKNADGSVYYPQGVDAKSSGYNLNMGWVFGNQFLSYTWKGAPLDLWKQVDTFNKDATKSKALGFTFDASKVKTEKAALQSVLDQYKMGLEFGVLDPDKTLPEFISKLKAAGIDKYIQEKQRQLDEWAKNNNVK